MSDPRPEPGLQASADQRAQDARVLAQMVWAFWDELRRCNADKAEDEQMPLEVRVMLVYQFHYAMTHGDDEGDEE